MTDPYVPGTRRDDLEAGTPSPAGQASPAPAGPAPAEAPQLTDIPTPEGYGAQPPREQPTAEYAPNPEYLRPPEPQPAVPAPQPAAAQQSAAQQTTAVPYQPGVVGWGSERTGGYPVQAGYGGGGAGWQQAPMGAAQPPGPHRSRLAVWAVVVAVVLLLVSIMQTVLLFDTRSSLDAERRTSSSAQSRDEKRLKALEGTVKGLEKQSENTMDSAAVAKRVLPSIFQVVAGDYTGSSFAIGKAPGGGTYLLTNNHVVQPLLNSGRRTVKLERGSSTFSATVTEHNSKLDVAVLECNQKFDNLSPVSSPVEPGEPVVVIGSPLGLNDSVTTGVVSAAQRDVPGSSEKFIQFDAAINPGNSGGPVMNSKGEVVGIATEKARDAEGIGLAIPISVPCDKFSVCGS
jgi:putative serine protease PepD